MPSSNPPCFSTQPGRGVEGMSWMGALLISSCITIALKKSGIYYCILIIIAKYISGKYLLITMIYKTSAYHFRSCIARELQGNNVNCTEIMSGYLHFFCACKEG